MGSIAVTLALRGLASSSELPEDLVRAQVLQRALGFVHAHASGGDDVEAVAQVAPSEDALARVRPALLEQHRHAREHLVRDGAEEIGLAQHGDLVERDEGRIGVRRLHAGQGCNGGLGNESIAIARGALEHAPCGPGGGFERVHRACAHPRARPAIATHGDLHAPLVAPSRVDRGEGAHGLEKRCECLPVRARKRGIGATLRPERANRHRPPRAAAARADDLARIPSDSSSASARRQARSRR